MYEYSPPKQLRPDGNELQRRCGVIVCLRFEFLPVTIFFFHFFFQEATKVDLPRLAPSDASHLPEEELDNLCWTMGTME